MIVVDSSALLAVVLREPMASACEVVMNSDPDLAISAGTYAESLIVSSFRGAADAVVSLLQSLQVEVVPVNETTVHNIRVAHSRWGKGVHPAGLNFGDCFAYALAKERRCPLLYVGEDFGRTDIVSAI